MARLVSFGCSNTFGDCLPDCDLGPIGWARADLSPRRLAGNSPSSLAWPKLAADALSIDVVNLAASGSSNFEILNSIMLFDFVAGDIAAVLWTYTNRDTLYGYDAARCGETHTRVHPWKAEHGDPVCQDFYKAHSDYDLSLRSWMYWHHTATHLRYKGIPFVMSSLEPWDVRARRVDDYAGIDPMIFMYPFDDLALDGLHPGPVTHERWAREFASNIRSAVW